MNNKRLELALEKIAPSEWEVFEEFASQFLANEFGDFRRKASPSGDMGRDAELFSPQGKPSVVFQFFVTADWSTKIKNTARRIKETFPDATILIYVTNQKIGATA